MLKDGLKRTLGILAALAVLVGGAAPAFAGPKLVVPEMKKDFGSVRQGEEAKFEFVLRNEGDEPLEIGEVEPSCGCTAALVTDNVVEPGGEARISGSVKTVGFQDRITKSVTVTTNDPDMEEIALTITGLVEVPFHLEPRYLNFGQVTHGESTERVARLTVRDENKLPVTIGEVDSKNPHLTTTVTQGENPAEFEIKVILIDSAPQGVVSAPIEIPIEGEAQPLRLSVYANVVGPVALYPQTVSLGLVEPEREVVRNFVVMSPTKEDFDVTEATCDLPGCTTSFEALKTEPKRVRITVKVNGAELPAGRVQGTLTVTTTASSAPLTAQLLGSVQTVDATPQAEPAPTPGE